MIVFSEAEGGEREQRADEGGASKVVERIERMSMKRLGREIGLGKKSCFGNGETGLLRGVESRYRVCSRVWYRTSGIDIVLRVPGEGFNFTSFL